MVLSILLVLLGAFHLATAAPAPANPAAAVLEARIIAGTEVKSATDFPSVASLQERLIGFTGCGGTVLAETKIITAAHCLEDLPKEMQLRFRAGSLTHADGGQLVHVVKQDPHPDYNKDMKDFDVAIVTVSPALDFGPNINKAKLVKSGAKLKKDREVTVLGWGTTNPKRVTMEDISPTLQQVTLKAVDRKACREAYQGHSKRKITDAMFCAAAEGKDSCKGDSGGPLFDTKTGVLLGAVSWSKSCASPRFPSVNVDFSNPNINKWINDQLKTK